MRTSNSSSSSVSSQWLSLCISPGQLLAYHTNLMEDSLTDNIFLEFVEVAKATLAPCVQKTRLHLKLANVVEHFFLRK